jgi:Mn2+/Fe2+ NRAMP family transporter
LGRFALGDLVIGNALTLVAEFIAICAGARYFGIPPLVAVAATFAIVVAAFALGRYRLWERVVIGLALGNCVFIPAAFFAHADPRAVFGSFGALGLPPIGGGGAMFLTLCMANIGATVTPWMIFFQQSAVVDKGLTRADLPQARIDTALGAAVAAIAAIATVVAASPLFTHHVDPANLSSGADFASALRPYLGNVGATLFALGMIEAGLVAIMTISTSSAYAIGDVSHRGASLNLDFAHARLFYVTGLVSVGLAAAIVLIPGAPLLAITRHRDTADAARVAVLAAARERPRPRWRFGE